MSQTDAGEITVVCAADDAYALPLAVTIRSALETLDARRRMRLLVLDGGISDTSKRRLLASWSFRDVAVEWIAPDPALVDDLQISRHVNLITYYRLLMPWVLPAELGRVIFLDADLLVRRDLSELWDVPLNDAACLAATDTAAPRLDARTLANFDRCHRFLAAVEPIPNWRDLSLDGGGKYFNAGVLVVDLPQWRAVNLAEQALRCLREHHEHVRWWDQYALNVLLAGRWNELDPRWNQGAHAYTFPTPGESPFEAEMFHALRNDPWIVHFTSHHKPWHYFSRHPFRNAYYEVIDRTEWQGWRPTFPSERGLKKWWDYHVAPLRHAVKVSVVRTKRLAGRGK